MTPAQQAASDALGSAVLATETARRAMDGQTDGDRLSRQGQTLFETWSHAFRAETKARAALAATVAQEVSDG